MAKRKVTQTNDEKDRNNDEKLSTVLSNGCDMGARRIYLFGEIDAEASYRFMISLHIMDESDGPITVVLNSAGGTCIDGFAIYDAIRFARNDVYIVGFGEVSSMGTIIMQAGTKRLLSPECQYLLHDVRTFDVGDLTLRDSQDLTKELQRLEDRGNKIFVERTGQSEETVRGWSKKETILSAQEAVELNLADEVIGTKEIK